MRYLADRTALIRNGDFQLSTFRVMAAMSVESSRVPNRRFYVFCGAVSRNQLAATKTDPSTRLLQLAVIGLVTGFFCYGLARLSGRAGRQNPRGRATSWRRAICRRASRAIAFRAGRTN